MTDRHQEGALLHATAVALGQRGLLLVGPPGAGKSDLALRLIDRGAFLVADDQVRIARVGHRLLASPPEKLAGLVEMRGVGIVRRPFAINMPIVLICDLAGAVERLPPPPAEWARRCIEGIALPVLALAPFEASAPLKIETALRLLVGEGAPLGRD